MLNHLYTGRTKVTKCAQEAHGAPRFSLSITTTYSVQFSNDTIVLTIPRDNNKPNFYVYSVYFIHHINYSV